LAKIDETNSTQAENENIWNNKTLNVFVASLSRKMDFFFFFEEMDTAVKILMWDVFVLSIQLWCL